MRIRLVVSLVVLGVTAVMKSSKTRTVDITTWTASEGCVNIFCGPLDPLFKIYVIKVLLAIDVSVYIIKHIHRIDIMLLSVLANNYCALAFPYIV